MAAISGTSFLFLKVTVSELPPTVVALVRIALGALVLTALLAVRGEPLPRSPATWAHLSVGAAFGLALPFTLFGYGERTVPSSLAGIWNATTPLVAVPFATLAFRTENVTPRKAAGLVLGLVGVAVVLGVWQPSGTGAALGHVLCLGAAACYGIAIPYQHRFLAGSGHSAVSLAAAQLLIATVELAIIASLIGGRSSTVARLSAATLLSVLVLGIVGTGLGFLLSLHNIRLMGAVNAATVSYAIPLVAVLAGVVVLGETPSWNHVLGALIVVVAVAITRSRCAIAGPRIAAVTCGRSKRTRSFGPARCRRFMMRAGFG